MATSCVCGNHLSDKPTVKSTMSPCKCDAPGPGRTVLVARHGIPEFCFERQYEQRTRLGLPLMTDIEKSVRSRWI